MLMEYFYKNWMVDKMTKVEALRRAQSALESDPSGKFAAKRFWAGWVLVGDPG